MHIERVKRVESCFVASPLGEVRTKAGGGGKVNSDSDQYGHAHGHWTNWGSLPIGHKIYPQK